jgi:hypothetical protein
MHSHLEVPKEHELSIFPADQKKMHQSGGVIR